MMQFSVTAASRTAKPLLSKNVTSHSAISSKSIQEFLNGRATRFVQLDLPRNSPRSRFYCHNSFECIKCNDNCILVLSIDWQLYKMSLFAAISLSEGPCFGLLLNFSSFTVFEQISLSAAAPLDRVKSQVHLMEASSTRVTCTLFSSPSCGTLKLNFSCGAWKVNFSCGVWKVNFSCGALKANFSCGAWKVNLLQSWRLLTRIA